MVAVYVDRPIDEQRREYLTVLDKEEVAAERSRTQSEEARRVERDAIVRTTATLLARINEAFRTMQILGQLLKDFPGTLTGEQKERITRAVYGVSLRTLTFVHQLVRQHPDEIARQVVDAIRSEHPDLSIDDVLKEAGNFVRWYIYVSSYGMTVPTAANVASPLLDPVFAEIERTDPVPAVKLISMAIRLERAGAFPESVVRNLHAELVRNPLAHRVLLGLVNAHFHMFDVPRPIKQSICAVLGIKYQPLPPRARTLLIAPPPGS